MNLLNLFANEPAPVTLDAGQQLFAAGDVGDSMYVVLAGEVDLMIKGQVIGVAQPGDILGEMALVEKLPRVATAVARTPVKLAAISERRFGYLVQNHPFFALHVMRVLAQRLRRMDEMITPADSAEETAAPAANPR